MTTLSLFLMAITVIAVSLIDFIPRFLAAAKMPIKVNRYASSRVNFFILPTVYGDISYLKNIDFLRKYPGKVIICTSKTESRKFYNDLRKVCKENGFRYTKADVPIVRGKAIVNAYTIYKGLFKNYRSRGIKSSDVCLLIDADTYSRHSVRRLATTFEKNNCDIASLSCEVNNPKTAIEKLQAYEYSVAMKNRRHDKWLTSGACNIGRASVYSKVFSRHSNHFAGGDIEIGKLAKLSGYKVDFIDFSFYTAAPDKLKDWFNQRIIWFSGGFRHHIINIATFSKGNLFLMFYNSLLVYLLFPIKWIEVINFPLTLLFLILVSWIMTFVINVGFGWRPVLLLLPLYSFLQTMIILPLAFARYVKIARIHRSFGYISIDKSLKGLSWIKHGNVLGATYAAVVVYAAYFISSSRIEYWSTHGWVSELFNR